MPHTSLTAAAAHHTRLRPFLLTPAFTHPRPRPPSVRQLTSLPHCFSFRILYSSFITCLPHNIRPHSHHHPSPSVNTQTCRVSCINNARRSSMQACCDRVGATQGSYWVSLRNKTLKKTLQVLESRGFRYILVYCELKLLALKYLPSGKKLM